MFHKHTTLNMEDSKRVSPIRRSETATMLNTKWQLTEIGLTMKGAKHES